MPTISEVINIENVSSLLSDLVAIASPYFEEDAIMAYVYTWFQANNLPIRYHRYYDEFITDHKGCNVIGEISQNKGLNILFNGHLDTVKLCEGWTKPPLEATMKNGKLYGLGALDMKAGCVAIMLAVKAFNSYAKTYCGSIHYHFVSDEEGPFGLGTDALIQDGLCQAADLAIVPEPSAAFTGNNFPSLCLGARGGYHYTVTVTGKSAHAANPEQGINAVVEAAKLLLAIKNTALRSDDILGKGDICILGLTGGGAICSVAERAQFNVFRHIVSGESKQTILEEVAQAAQKVHLKGSYQVSFRQSPTAESDGFMPYTVDRHHPYTEKLLDVITEVTAKTATIDYFNSIGDFNYLGSRLAIPTYVLGPSGENYHSADEYVNVEDVVKTSEILFHFMWKMLKASE